MKLITSHLGSDFDSLASMVAAAKLHEGAVMSFSGSACRNVREFVKRYRTRWNILTPRKVNLDEVTSLIVVDARSKSRIGAFSSLVGRPNVEIFVYDHHPPSSDDIPADHSLIESVGATTSIMVRLIMEKGIPVTSHEATLFAMGIYEDTGGMTFGATTREDFEMISRLREFGADLTLIPSHVEMSLDASERSLLDMLISNASQRYINGARVVLSFSTSKNYIEGLSLFVHRLRDYFDADVAIAVVSMVNSTYVVARSREEILDVSEFLEPLGGGGHPQAASATLRYRDPLELLKELEGKLERNIKPAVTVKDVMTSPVKAVDRETSVDDAYRAMIRYGHSALPVIREGEPVGVITRKDLDKARLHGFGLALVEEFMTEGVITIPLEASVAEAHHIMVIHNIGRLPVMEAGILSGILTRTDILRALYPASLPPEDRYMEPDLPWTEDISFQMKRTLSGKIIELLDRLGQRADKLHVNLYIVGGIVRDLLLGRPNVDLDLVVEGDAVKFIKSWAEDGCNVAVHSRYKTGTIVFPDDLKVDVATARREFYEYPVALPTVSSDSLKHDLYRRDFTVNAMAVCINRSSVGQLIDYFGGRRDLSLKSIRVLHNLSFVEDPTRVIRGIRIEERLGFSIEDNTLRLLNSCVRGGLLSLLSGFRLRSELELSFLEKDPHLFIKKMQERNVWEALFPGIRVGKESTLIVRRISFLLRRLKKNLPSFGKDLWLAFLAAILYDSSETVLYAVEDRLHLSQKERKCVQESILDTGSVEQDLGGSSVVSNSRIYHYLKNYVDTQILFWLAATNRFRVRRRIMLYLGRLHKVESMLTGRDILDMGYPEGPDIGNILEKLRDARLDGAVETREDEIEWVLQHFSKYKGE